MNDTAAFLQQEYDQAAAKYGLDSPEAKAAEKAATNYFKGTRAPVTPAFQKEYSSWVS